MKKIRPVEYFFVGPPKTGTTWIYEVLRKTKGVSLSIRTKELEFFNKNFHRGNSWYHNSFKTNGNKACDISTSYFISETACKRIHAYNPGARIIITIRHPVKRLISHYKHNIRFGILKKMTIDLALKEQPNLLQNSMYAKHFMKWLNKFGRENVLILPLELLSKDPTRYISMLNEFMGIEIDLKTISHGEKVNYSSQPRNYFIAKSARIIRKKINQLGFYRIIEISKKLGLKKLIFEGGADIPIDESTMVNLMSHFSADIQELKKFRIPEEIIEIYTND